jgi:CubicO group peptidase (beta-lactamase class C family)
MAIMAIFRMGSIIRHVPTGESGIPDYPDLNADYPGVTNAEILAALQKAQNLAFPPGQKYQYCNGGYVLLGLIVENITRRPLSGFLESQVFNPLRVTSTFVLTNLNQKTADVARGYDRVSGRS